MIRTVLAFGFVIIMLLFVIRSPAAGPIRLPSVTKVARTVASATTKFKVATQEFRLKKPKKRTPSVPAQTTR